MEKRCMNSNKKIWIEGLRGVLCLVVFVHHFMMAFYPKHPIIFYNDGSLAVIFFLLLTGAVLPLSSNKHSGTAGIKKIGRSMLFYVKKRYLRLLPTIVVAMLLSYMILRANCYKTQEVAGLFGLDVIAKYFNFDITVRETLFDVFIGVFFRRPLLDTPLWTIRYEFWGAIVAYAMLTLLAGNKYRHWIYLGIGCLYFFVTKNVYFPCILVGIVISDIFFVDSNLKTFLKEDKRKWLQCLLIILAIMIYILTMHSAYCLYGKVFVAILGLIIIPTNGFLRKVMSVQCLVELGKYSYQIYAVHWPLICSFSCFLMLLMQRMNYILATTITFVLTLGLSMMVGIILNRGITSFSRNSLLCNNVHKNRNN